MELSERKKQILRAVVENYIQTAEPVGSKAIVASSGLKVSSATIRNEMAELENMGLLEQPHTSAGRIPSPKGYRLYVNELMEEHRLSMQEARKINDALNLKIREMDQVMTEAGKIISQLTKYPTFALTKGTKQAVITRYDLLMVEDNAFIAVLMTDTQAVKNKYFRLPSPVSQTQLQLLGTLLNTSFTGLTLAQLQPELARVSSHAAGEAYGLINLVVSFAMEVLEELESNVVHTAGIPTLLAHPEYQSLEKAEPAPDELPLGDGRRDRQPAGGPGGERPHRHRPGERGRRAQGLQRHHGQLRHRRRDAGGHRRGGSHPDGLRRPGRPAVLLRRGAVEDVRQGGDPAPRRRRRRRGTVDFGQKARIT